MNFGAQLPAPRTIRAQRMLRCAASLCEQAARAGGRGGFTLIEMLIAVSLLGLLVAIVVPQSSSLRAALAVVRSADEFVSSISMAQSYALRHGGIAEVHVDVDADRFWVEVDTTFARQGVKDTMGIVVELAGRKVVVSSQSAVVCYDPRGLAVELSGCSAPTRTIVFSRDSYADTVSLTVVGKVRR